VSKLGHKTPTKASELMDVATKLWREEEGQEEGASEAQRR
jgi:hypothetical protein